MVDETIQVIKINEAFFKIQCNISQNMELREFFSCYAPNYFYHPKYRAKMWDGKISFFDTRNKLLPSGLLIYFDKFCKKFDYKYKFLFDTKELYLDIQDQDLINFYSTFLQKSGKYFPRDYQHKTIQKLLSNKKGVIESATGSGKSLCIYVLTRFFLANNQQVLIVVPTQGLVEQMHSDFGEYGWESVNELCNKLYSKKELNLKKPVLISTYQSIAKKPTYFFDRFSAIIIDEVQHAKSFSIKQITQKCTKAEFRFGVTGTLPKEQADIYNIYGFLGPKIYSLTSKELIDRGVLSKITIANLILKYPPHMVLETKNKGYQNEIDTILEYENRNKSLDFIIKNTPQKQNTLLLCGRVEKHLNKVEEYIQQKFPNKKLYKIYGGISADERENIRKLMEKEDDVILIATYQTMSTGINIKKIHQIIFYSSYKSKIKVLQSLGRGLRKHKSKTRLILWDVVDNLCWKKRTGTIGKNHVYKHWEERTEYYREQGFKSLSTNLEI